MVDIGIVGLAKSGRTTVFNLLTKDEADAGGTVTPTRVTQVPEPRLKILADIFHPKRVVPAEVKYHDVAASAKGLTKGKGISGQFLAQLSNVDALINVVRVFTDESILHIEGSLDLARDIATIELELIFSDLAIIERRLQKIELSLKGAKLPERQRYLQEREMLAKLKADLEKDIPIRELKPTAAEARVIAGYQFLSAKPLLIVLNIGEDQLQLSQVVSLEAELNLRYARLKYRVISLCGQLEMELAQLDNSAAEGFRAEFGIKESGLDRTIKLTYELLGLISFFTTVSAEVKAWSIQNGTTALKAAGKIHSDIERGFIRAEVIGFDDMVKCGSLAEARKRGLLRLEGKGYIIRDGDVITFLFNV